MIGHILSDFLDWYPFKILCDLTWGPPAELGVNATAVVKSHVRELLQQYKIRSWGYHYTGGDIVSSVVKLLANKFFGPKIIASTSENPELPNAETDAPTAKELLFSVNKKKAKWTYRVLAMHKFPVTRVPRVALEKNRRRKRRWRL